MGLGIVILTIVSDIEKKASKTLSVRLNFWGHADVLPHQLEAAVALLLQQNYNFSGFRRNRN